jgi:hypothetical protein
MNNLIIVVALVEARHLRAPKWWDCALPDRRWRHGRAGGAPGLVSGPGEMIAGSWTGRSEGGSVPDMPPILARISRYHVLDQAAHSITGRRRFFRYGNWDSFHQGRHP